MYMQGTESSIKLIEYGSGSTPVILIGASEAKWISDAIPEVRLFNLDGFDWNRDLSPWPSLKVFKGGEAFGGQADQLLETLLHMLDDRSIHSCMIGGYSLAGLFALYASTKTDRFTGCFSCSGSLWYPGFLDYLKVHPSLCKRVYLSLGDKEKKSKSAVLSQVEDCTRRAETIIAQHATAIFELNPGGHFEAESKRIVKGISWILESKRN